MHFCNFCGFDLRRWNSRFKYKYNTGKLWISIHFRRSKVLFGYVWLATFNPKSIYNWFCERTLFILIHCGFRFFWQKSTEYLEWTPLCWNLSIFFKIGFCFQSHFWNLLSTFLLFSMCVMSYIYLKFDRVFWYWERISSGTRSKRITNRVIWNTFVNLKHSI